MEVHTAERFEGGQTVTTKVFKEFIPVFVRVGYEKQLNLINH
jgi:alpha-glucosidase (family GH31 glycosyl hydrolase)